MQLERILSLIIYMNANLKGTPLSFNEIHSGMKVASYHLFKGKNMQLFSAFDPILIAVHPEQWMDYLNRRNVSHLQLRYYPFSNHKDPLVEKYFSKLGDQWILEAIHDSKKDIYFYCEYGLQNPPSRLLGCKLFQILQDLPNSSLEERSLGEIQIKFQKILQQLIEFANSFERSRHWATYFRNLLNQLNGPVSEEIESLFPATSITVKARQVLVTALNSQVFGGMGSWNDQHFGDQQGQYEDLSNQLFHIIQLAIMTSINQMIP